MAVSKPEDDPIDIEITPEMIEAGAAEVLAMDWWVADAEDLAEWVYEAMSRARSRKSTRAGLRGGAIV